MDDAQTGQFQLWDADPRLSRMGRSLLLSTMETTAAYSLLPLINSCTRVD